MVSLANAKTYGKGETIYTEGDTADSVWILMEGRVQIFKYTSGGRPQAIESLGPKELFGTLCRLGNNGRTYPCTAATSTPCTIIRVLDRTFLDFYNRFPAPGHGRLLSLQSAAECGAGLELQRSGACRKADCRHPNARLQKEHGDTLLFTKREIAELAATTVETTIRTMSTFAKKGWITSSRGKIGLKDPAKIKKLLETLC